MKAVAMATDESRQKKHGAKKCEIPRKKGGVIGRLRLGTFAVSSDSRHHITETDITFYSLTQHMHADTEWIYRLAFMRSSTV